MTRLIALSILAFLFLSTTTVFAQPPDTLWTRTYGGTPPDQGNSVRQTSDGGYIIAGYTDPYGGDFEDVWLIRTDPDGHEIWSNTFGDGDSHDVGRCVQPTNDGGYIIAGYRDPLGYAEQDLWAIKTDSVGNEVWSYRSIAEDRDRGEFVIEANDSSFIIAGILVINDENSYIWLIKIDSDGDEVWSRTFGGAGRVQGGYCVQQTIDDGFVISGWSNNFFADLYLVKTDSEGNEEWSRSYGGNSTEVGYSVQQTTDGGFIIAGLTESYGAGDYDVWLIHTDSQGNEVWSRTFGGTDDDWAESVHQTMDGGFLITGYTESFGAGGGDAWLIKTDSGGNEVWSKTMGGPEYDFGASCQQTLDGGFIVVGTTSSFGAGNDDLWLIRLGADDLDVMEGDVTLPTYYRIEEIYPNPFNPTTTITLELPASSDLRISVFNLVGQEVAVLTDGQFAQGQQQFTFDATGLSTGIYFVQATVPGKMNEMRKVVYLK
jgi:Secretion system C-terminal sorting domain